MYCDEGVVEIINKTLALVILWVVEGSESVGYRVRDTAFVTIYGWSSTVMLHPVEFRYVDK